MILIVDCGSQLTQNIARRIREMGVLSEIVPYTTPVEAIAAQHPDGIVLSGGPFSVYDQGAPLYDGAVFSLGVPVLGICYGLQSMAYLLGGSVKATDHREYGETKLRIEQDSRLWNGIPEREWTVWMSHDDIVEQPPEGFVVLARSQSGHIAAMQRGELFAVQYHPEVDHSRYGRQILKNFLEICDARRDWDVEKEFDRIVERTREQIQGKVGIGGISGGIDSSALSVLIGQVAGDAFHPIFVDNGLLRANEMQQVQQSLAPFHLRVRYVDAAKRFLESLRGVTDPDEKRRRIGHDFVHVFEEEARKIPEVSYLAQGTLYPDVIESVPLFGTSSKIKRHHNVGGLPEVMKLEVVEPFRHLFKDEVRAIAEKKLGLPATLVWRHPFPGPGLAVRIIGEVTEEKLAILRHADAILIEELRARGLYHQIAQALIVLTNAHSVGVMGDAGTYEGVAVIRAVTTNDFMTADWFDFEGRDLRAIANRIINEVRGINRVVYDVSQKPPSTIEWE